MNIAIFAGALNEHQDGVTRVLHRHIRFYKRLGYRMYFFTPSYNEGNKLENVTKISSIPFPLYSDHKLSLPLKRKITRELEKLSPDLVFIHSPCTLGLIATKGAEELKIPAVAEYHTHFPTYLTYYKISFLERYVWRYMRYLYSKCEVVFVPSKSVEKNLNENGISNTVFIPHGVDTEVFNPKFFNAELKTKLGIEGKKIVLFVGRIVKEKNLDILVQAVELLAKREDFVLVVAGGGPYLKYYQSRTKRALFLGHLHTNELAQIYASSDIFVFPSVTETFGNVILEGMASGLPPVVANSFGASELISNFENGILVAPNS
ncbi:MAG: glycosyltransferase family 4 protein, partial [Candidatus Kapaibacteriota bacterium]